MEYIDVFDDGLNYIGRMSKQEAHLTGAWHKSIHCWIVRNDENGQYVLFQKRSKTKSSFPNYLDISAAGHYKAGEKREDGVREIVEELGIKVNFSDLLYLGIKFDVYKDDNIFNREFCETFLYEDNRELDKFLIDCDEVTGLVQIRIEDGLDLFSGRVSQISASGMEYSENTKSIDDINIMISKDMFISRIDPYYGKIFMISKMYFSGEKNLFI